ncbi:Lpg1974 family pore-forming outer membrane protein [Legionella fallonii]|nr:Lpg1974 family pore-forming outer membrane protein [Legionella fallonii]
MLKKTTLAVIGLAASSFASAGTMGPVCAPGNVTVPCEAKLWDFGIQALYLQSSYGGAKAAELFQNVNNKWNFGFRAEGSYHYSTGSDITVDWTHYSNNTNQSGFVGIIPVFPFSAPFTQTNENRLDQVNVVFGQHVDFGLVKKLRFYGGMQYANLQVNETNYYPSVFVAQILSFSPIDFLDNTDFKGFGPVLGIDYSYNLTPALKVTANGAGSILYGTSRYDGEFVVTAVGLVVSPTYIASKAIVPTVQAKLGLNYEYNMPQGVVNFEGGYQVINYFNVLQTQPLQNPLSPITTVNYGLYGPYFGVKYLGNV